MVGNSPEKRLVLNSKSSNMSTKLFVGNLSFNTTENDLQEAFAAHGTVVEANLMMDRTAAARAALPSSPCPRRRRRKRRFRR